MSEPIRWKLPGDRIRYLLRVSGIGLLQRAKALYPDIVRILLSSCGEGQSIADARGDDMVQSC
ncbi:hypothetical protein WI41_06545 [Burkholderia latens]|uniref:Uncharacterized protein n=1 Tax=Burkholderia latens TaxID=488446 RepID=A0AAP1C8R3_9BURK|nr:hypothetical protein [Burkholderia latens]KVA11752.1 hypothetical protein WI41_06545 [Burkholderia latens]